jgi:hypothetical protein
MSATPQATPHMDQLREHLMQTLASLRDRENPMEPDRARAVAQVAGVLVDTARVEVDYLKATNQTQSAFFSEERPALSQSPTDRLTSTGFLSEVSPGVTRHQLRG